MEKLGDALVKEELSVLRKPLEGKYKKIPKLQKEIEKIKLDKEKEYWMRVIGRVPNLDKFK